MLLSPRITSQMACTPQQQPIFILQELLRFLHSRDVVSGSKCWRLCRREKIILRAALSSQNPSSLKINKISQRIKLSSHLVASHKRKPRVILSTSRCQTHCVSLHSVQTETDISNQQQPPPLKTGAPLFKKNPHQPQKQRSC